MPESHQSLAALTTLRDTVLADRALVARLSTIADQEAVLDELMAVARSKDLRVEQAAVRQALESELTAPQDAELSDEDLEMVAAGSNASVTKSENTGGRRRPAQ